MYRSIIVPLDGSSSAEAAVEVAGQLAGRDHAALHLLHVHTPYPTGDGGKAMDDALRTAERLYVERMAQDAAGRFNIAVFGESLDGHPADVICANVVNLGVDLVVMTSHGRTGFSRFWLGSVTDEVVRRTGAPVFVLRPDDQASAVGAHSAPTIRRILITVDGSSLATQVIPHAVNLGGTEHCQYTLARVVESLPLIQAASPYVPAPDIMPDGDATTAALIDAKAEVAVLAERLRHQHDGLNIQTEVCAAPVVVDGVLAMVREHAPDVMAVATHGRGVSRLMFGSVADKLLRASSTAMLVFRPLHD